MSIAAFCQEHAIRLLIDAAHPFAEELHLNIFAVATEMGIPLVRFDRIYPPHTDDIIWCKDYDDAIQQLQSQKINRLLALTGVQTIGRLRNYWQQNDCWMRILDRNISREIAQREGFPADRLVYYTEEDNRTQRLIQQVHPQAILTKESGLSGGFNEKVEAAKAAGVKIFVVERPRSPLPAPRSSITPNTQHPSPNTQHPSPITQPTWTIVLASQVAKKNAEIFVGQLKGKGYADTEIVQRAKGIKVVYGHFESESEAQNQLRKLRQQSSDFAEAWVMNLK